MSLKILLINHAWLQSELQALGHTVKSVSLNNPGTDIQIQTPGIELEAILSRLPFVPDRIVWYDDSGLVWIRGVARNNTPKIFYSVDSHHHHSWHPDFSSAFDRVLVAQRDYLELFKRYHQNPIWFPAWTERLPEIPKDKSFAATFVGNVDAKNHPLRKTFFEAVAKLAPLQVFQGDYTQYYPRSKIVLNQNVKKDLNFRVFEAMACGALLITPDIDQGLKELFTPGQHLITYQDNNAEDAARKINYYLEHEEVRARIAEAGMTLVRRDHTPHGRAQALLGILRDLKRVHRPLHFYGAAVTAVAVNRIGEGDGLPWAKVFVAEGANCLVSSANRKEKLDREFVILAVVVARLLEMLNQVELADKMLEQLSPLLPTEKILPLIRIRILKTAGHLDYAHTLAAHISADPVNVVANAESLLATELNL